MSIPNVAHLDPQRGGCCTVMPYFVGNILELPVTTIQDYSLFKILNDYSLAVWERQTECIIAANGLATFITHPDYLRCSRAWSVYTELLRYLSSLRDQRRMWLAQPGEVNDWWRARAAMRVVRHNNTWSIEGRDCERARLAWAVLDNDRVRYSITDKTAGVADTVVE
jgi:hypothetical protein